MTFSTLFFFAARCCLGPVASKRQVSILGPCGWHPLEACGESNLRAMLRHKLFSDAGRQVAEMNPEVASGGTGPILSPDLMEFFRKFPFVVDAIGVQVQSIAPINFSGLRIDLQRGFPSDREPLLIFRLLACRLLLDRNVWE